MHRCGSSLIILLTAATLAHAQPINVNPASVLARMQALKPAPAALRWQQVPWLTDLKQGLALAKKENRPMLLWGSDDDPLDRC
jgi:hypothetical protein